MNAAKADAAERGQDRMYFCQILGLVTALL